MANEQTLEKYPGETRDYHFDFKNLLLGAAEITSVDSVTESVEEGTETTGLTIGSTDTNTQGDTVQAEISGGTSGVLYRVKCTVSTNTGETLVVAGQLRIL